MSKRKEKNPNGKVQHQERLTTESQNPSPSNEPINGISSPKLVNRPKFRGNVPKMRPLIFRPNQQRFIDCIQNSETNIVILVGPAGTGKTLLAVRKGLEGVLNGRFADLVLCRPLVEAGGEELGFLPGGVDDKIGPYLEPFYDKLTAFLSDPVLKNLLAAKHITATPLAYMRGRTFSESMVIIDEAQNTTVEQIKMAVTRLGPFSKMVICGDPEQSDIKGMNGLEYLTKIFEKEGKQTEENGCYLCRLGIEDIQRNCVIPYLLEAFSKFKADKKVIDSKTTRTQEDQLAFILKKTLKFLIREENGGRSSSRIKGPKLFQPELFEIPRSPLING
jgi:phosphate starvation-inducible PhoH-like protein